MPIQIPLQSIILIPKMIYDIERGECLRPGDPGPAAIVIRVKVIVMVLPIAVQEHTLDIEDLREQPEPADDKPPDDVT